MVLNGQESSWLNSFCQSTNRVLRGLESQKHTIQLLQTHMFIHIAIDFRNGCVRFMLFQNSCPSLVFPCPSLRPAEGDGNILYDNIWYIYIYLYIYISHCVHTSSYNIYIYIYTWNLHREEFSCSFCVWLEFTFLTRKRLTLYELLLTVI